MQRSRIDTENRLLDAVGQLIVATGLNQIGINRISSHSGINKILIYRYFGGLDGLLKAYYDRTKPIVSVPLLVLDIEENQPYRNLERLSDLSQQPVYEMCNTD